MRGKFKAEKCFRFSAVLLLIVSSMAFVSAQEGGESGLNEQTGAGDEISVTVTRTPENYVRMHFPGLYDFFTGLPFFSDNSDEDMNATRV